MKSFLVFLAGAITTIIAAAVVAGLLFSPTGSNPPKQAVPINAQVIPPNDRFILSGTVVVPDALKGVVKAGKGHISIWLTTDSGQRGVLPIIEDGLYPTFPFKFSYALSKQELLRPLLLKKNLGISVYYKPTDDPGPPAAGLFLEPRVTASYKFPIEEQDLAKGTLPSSLELGELPFFGYYDRSITAPCISDKVLLAGKISVEPQLLREHGRDKFALMIYQKSLHGFNDVSPESGIVYKQFVDVSSGSFTFRAPAQKTGFPYFLVSLVRCEPDDALSACVRRGMAPGFDQNKYRYVVLASNLRNAFCGMDDFSGVVGPLSSDFFARRAHASVLGEKANP